MEDYVKRVFEERRELDSKLLKLTEFVDTNKFKELSEINQKLLIEQESIMADYSKVLSERLVVMTENQNSWLSWESLNWQTPQINISLKQERSFRRRVPTTWVR